MEGCFFRLDWSVFFPKLSIRAVKSLLCNAVTYPPNLVEKSFGKSEWVPNPDSEGRQKGRRTLDRSLIAAKDVRFLDEFLVKRVHH